MIEKKLEALEMAKNYINNLEEGIDKIYKYISEGEEEKSLSLIPHFADGIAWLTEVLTLTRDIHKSEINIEEVNELLNEIVEALENEDYILVGDLFKYEMYSMLEDIQNNI